MRKTQIEQIQEATHAYIMPLNHPKDGMATHRFQVYLQTNGKPLEVLWPMDTDSKKELIAGQVYTTRREYPAFHFALSGCGYDKADEIARTLDEINNRITTFTLTGYQPHLT